jgi:predicted dehydrogenase/threonine dehydrogenase-like Zn-dependent dehydrogenase
MLLDFGRSSWLQKIRSQPDKVRQVRQKIASDGLLPTLRAVRRKLAAPLPLGYSHVGRVLAVGEGVDGLEPGDLVLSNGPHSEVVSVPRHLCVKIPRGVPPEEAVFGIVGAIGLQGIRLVAPTLGEQVAVIGLGLIGQLTVQLLLAQGCQVLAIDLDPRKVALAEGFGAAGLALSPAGDPLEAVRTFSAGRGVDAVIIAAATSSNAPLLQACEMCRPRGRIVLVGVVAIQAPRDLFYKKELSFQVSCSYGPGRYDPAYEEGGQDYPLAHVRWTEQRNIQAVLEQMAAGRVRCAPLLSLRFPFVRAADAYDALLRARDAYGIVLDYPVAVATERSVALIPKAPRAAAGIPGIALIGAGQYALSTLLPALDKAPPHRRLAVLSRQGASAGLAAQRFRFERASTDLEAVLGDPGLDAVLITTRHDSHADLVVCALQAGKHVFVEKPLATTLADLERVRAAMASRPDLTVTVGFNRPWAPLARRLEAAFESRGGPLHLLCEINAGALPSDHWTLGVEGGGRLVGEGCHFIDLMRHWVGRPISDQVIQWVRRSEDTRADGFSLALGFEDGSQGTLVYTTIGHKGYPKETYTAHWDGKVARLDNFQRLKGWGTPGVRGWGQDKGHAALLAAWIGSLNGSRIQDPEALLEVSRIALEADA